MEKDQSYIQGQGSSINSEIQVDRIDDGINLVPDDGLKMFEKLSGSMLAMNKKDDEWMDITSKNYIDKNIDVMGSSPGEKYIVTWSREDVKTPFNKTTVESNEKIYVSISECGGFASISKMTIIENTGETVNMDSVNSHDLSKPEACFAVYSTTLNHQHDHSSRINSLPISGPLIFCPHSRMVCFTEENMYIFSTNNWKIINNLSVSQLIKIAPNYSSDSNAFLSKVYDILICSLKNGYIIWPETSSGLSVWDLEGTLKQWFYIESKNQRPSHNLYAISKSGEIVARFHEEINQDHENLGILSIFHIPTALSVCDIEVPSSTFYIALLAKTEQIIVFSNGEDGIRVQIWDCWSGLLVHEENCPRFNSVNPFVFLNECFVQAIDNELQSCLLFASSPVSTNLLERVKECKECKAPGKGLKFSSAIEQYMSRSICWGYIHDNEDVLISKFLIEPWNNFTGSEMITARWLDYTGNRFLVIGEDSVQVYKTNYKENQKFLKIELQYMWVVPITQDANIQSVSLETCEDEDSDDFDNEEDLLSYNLHVKLTNNFTTVVPIPGVNETASYRIISDACASIHHIRLQFPEEGMYFNRLAIREQLRKLLITSVQSYPSMFNKISVGEGEYIYPMEDFIALGWDNLVESILEQNRYIPLFHNDEQTESALSLLVDLQKSELVQLLVKFDLYMLNISYFTTSLETPTRILNTKLGNPYQIEERSEREELAAVTRRALLPNVERDEGAQKKTKKNWFGLTGEGIDVKDEKTEFFSKESYSSGKTKKIELKKEIYVNLRQMRKQKLADSQKTHPAKLCVVPWPDFSVYPSRKTKWNFFVPASERSPFADIALTGPPEMFNEVAMEAVIKFKCDGLQVARQAHLRQRAELIAEVELFLLTSSQRQHAEWFPHLIYYEAHADYINKWRQKLEQEEKGEVDVDFVKKELNFVKEELQNDLRELKEANA
ncbi:16437_t:CDS:2 [Acaulospora colombiana]|uniref:16437_t:CDS:1 n=1 Tax=Acaulospora colombiana TaxID=27376 RepID=A0ACA9K9B3_9GLOM|nr:16437_t:CDS:2 [Acaulospora colombiana]